MVLEKTTWHSGFGKGTHLQQGFGKGPQTQLAARLWKRLCTRHWLWKRPKGFGKGTPRPWERRPKALEKATHACFEPGWPKMGRHDVLLREICEEKYYYES